MSRIDDYELQAKLGVGGMGAVFKARQVSLDRIVALKVLAPKLATDASFVARFLREARSTAKLNHPNIVAGIGVGSAGGYHYFAMEFVEGASLKQQLETQGCFAESEVLRIGAAVASALAHAHASGIVHRDVKPDNILMARDGTPKLADLGLAKAAESAEEASLTQAGTALGTPHYIAPEQASGDSDIDGRADAYSLGCTLYHLATGHTPFQAKTSAAIMVKHINDKMAHPQTLRPELSDGLCLVLSRMVARDRDDRYASLDEAAADMDALARGGQPSCRPLPAAKSKFQAAPAVALADNSERLSTRRLTAIGASRPAEGATEIRESRRRIAAQPSANKWIPFAAGGGGLVLIMALVFLMGGKSNPTPPPPPDKAPEVARNTGGTANPPKLPIADDSRKMQPPTQSATVVRPTSVVAEKPPQPNVTPGPSSAPPPALSPLVVATAPANQPKATPPDAVALLGADLSGWSIQGQQWAVENGAMVCRAGAANGSIWKYGSLPVDFELTFNAEDNAQGFHFGWMTGSNATIYTHHEAAGLVRVARYLDPDNIEMAHASSALAHGKHAWRVVVRNSLVQIYIDNALMVESNKVEQSIDRKRDLCFFAHGGGGELHITQLLARDIANAPPTDVAAHAPKPEDLAKTLEAVGEVRGQVETLAAYATFAEEYLALLRKFDAKGAAARADRAEKDPALARQIEQLKQDRRLLALLDLAMTAELDGARKLTEVDDFELAMGSGAPQRVGKKAPLHVLRVEKGVIMLDGGGVSLPTNVAKLAAETRWKLAEMGLPSDGALTRAFVALLTLKSSSDSKSIAAAKSAIEAAKKNPSAGPDADCLERWVRLIEDGPQNAAAAATWPKLKALADQQQWRAMRASIGEFAHAYEKTRFFESKRGEIESLLKAAFDAEEHVGSPDELLRRLTAKLKAANPEFNGQLTPKIENGKIVEIQASSRALKDLSPFRSEPELKRLILHDSQITDLNALKGMQLTSLDVGYSQIKDLSPLSGMPLTLLIVAATRITDLSPLKGMPLEHLEISAAPVTDLSPLRGMPLKWFDCFACPGLSDLRPLQGMPLEWLNCSYNEGITDLTPIQNAPLKYLKVDHTRAGDLSALKNMKLVVLSLDYKPAHDAMLKDMTTLEQINGMTAAEFKQRAANGTLPK